MADVILIVILILVLTLAVRGCVQRKKKGSVCCGSNCSCCNGCSGKEKA